MQTRMMVQSFIVLAVCASGASATDMVVGPSGSGTTCTDGSPCALSYANANATAGTRVILKSGTYGTGINPSSSGASIASRIVYMGAASNPGAAIVPSISLNRSYVTVKWITVDGTSSIAADNGSPTATYDSLYRCNGENLFLSGAKYSTVRSCTFDGSGLGGYTHTILVAAKDGAREPNEIAGPVSERDTISDCTITIGDVIVDGINEERAIEFAGNSANLVFERNRTTGTMGAESACDAGGSQIAFEVRHTYASVFRNNRLDIEVSNGAAGDYRALAVRDKAMFNTFESDTIYAGLNASANCGVDVVLAQSGTGGANPYANAWSRCFYKVSGTVRSRSELNKVSITDCVFASSGNSGFNVASGDSLTIDHNTFYAVQTGTGMSTGAMSLADEEDVLSASNVSSNVFYVGQVAGCSGGSESLFSAVYNAFKTTTGFTQDRDLFFAADDESTAAVYINYGDCQKISDWCKDQGKDCNGKWGDPTFENSTFSTLNIKLQGGSPGLGLGTGGSDVGADRRAPSAVADLDVNFGRTAVYAFWTAPGDDETRGTATSYDLRYSTSEITEQTFPFVTKVTTSEPQAPGSTECVYISPLLQCTTYWFAVKTTDNAGQTSALSNVVQITMMCSPGTPSCENSLVANLPQGSDELPPFMLSPLPARENVVANWRAMDIGSAKAAIFDVSGRRVQTLRVAPGEPGRAFATWDLRSSNGQRVQGGVYFIHVRDGNTVVARRVIVVR